MWYTALKNLSKCFSPTLVSYEATPHDGLSERYRSQEAHGVMRTVLRHTGKIILLYIISQSEMATVRLWPSLYFMCYS